MNGSLGCYPIPNFMKAGNSVSPKTERPKFCKFGEFSELLQVDCTQCADGKMCANNIAATDDCTADFLNSRAGEYGCFPYQFTWPQNPAPAKFTTPTITDTKIAVEVRPGEYNWNGSSKGNIATNKNTGNAATPNFDCPKGYQCIFPFTQWWSKCPAGTYSGAFALNEASTKQTWACEPCADQKVCEMREDTVTDAGNGFWSPEYVHIPLAVRAGTAAGTGTTLEFCKAGYFSINFASSCTKCPDKKYCGFTSNKDINCNEGTAANSGGGDYTCEACYQH